MVTKKSLSLLHEERKDKENTIKRSFFIVKSFCSELEIIKVNEHKAMILMNCSDLEKFGAMLEQPELKQWDIDNNCVDTVYNLELVE